MYIYDSYSVEALKISQQNGAQVGSPFLPLIIWLVKPGKGRVGREEQTSQQAGGLGS